MTKLLKIKYLRIIILGAIIFTFGLLLAKNPFSERNLIANLEPYPDSIHYLNPALNFTNGDGLLIGREGRFSKPNVPFLYSATLIPGYLINSDVRFFYFTNILLAFAGLFFFYKFLTLIIKEKFTIYLILFLYVTNYFIYWFPNLPMAENIFLPLFTASLYLLASRVTPKNSVFASLIAIGFYAAKYASLVLTVTFLLLYLIKILLLIYPVNLSLKFPYKKNKSLFTSLGIFIISSAAFLIIFFLIEYLVKGKNILYEMYVLFSPIFATASPVITGQVVETPATNSWFSFSYFDKNFKIYIGTITGTSSRFLWDYTPLLANYIGIPALIGLFAGLFTKGYRFISFSLILLTLTPMIFISTFYSNDARYIYNAIPCLLAGYGFFLNFIYNLLKQKKLQKIFYLILLGIFIFYCFNNYARLKLQAVLNLKYAETPWYYLSAKSFSDYFNSILKTNNPPILVTSLPPYYVDFYNKSNFKLLPLSKEQEFFQQPEFVWGNEDYANLERLYTRKLNEGQVLYVTNAGLGNEAHLHRAYDSIKQNFKLTEVQKNCHDTCNIYKLEIK